LKLLPDGAIEMWYYCYCF